MAVYMNRYGGASTTSADASVRRTASSEMPQTSGIRARRPRRGRAAEQARTCSTAAYHKPQPTRDRMEQKSVAKTSSPDILAIVYTSTAASEAGILRFCGAL